MTRLSLACLLALSPLIATAQETTPAPPSEEEAPRGASTRLFQPPAGCTAYLTVQSRDCTVSHHFTCDADPDGWQRSVEMDEGGVSYFGAIDAETQWMESNRVLLGSRETLAPDPADPASFSELVATSRDSFDFVTLSDSYGETRYVGEDRLTGQTTEIDGVTLERTAFKMRALDAGGVEIYSAEGQQFISREWGMFLGGVSTNYVGGEVEELDNTPVEFVLPGEDGFLSATPKHGCGAMMSKAPRP